jgi:hypothetical protein
VTTNGNGNGKDSSARSGAAATPADVKIVPVKSRFAMLALREGGKTAAALLGAAEAFLHAERGRYLAWVDATLLSLDIQLDRLQGDARPAADVLDDAYRQAAQIRDLGGTFGAPLVTATADSLCELLYRLRCSGLSGGPAIAMHQSVLRLVCSADHARTTPDGINELLAGLKKIVAKYPRPQPPVRPAPDPAAAQAKPAPH